MTVPTDGSEAQQIISLDVPSPDKRNPGLDTLNAEPFEGGWPFCRMDESNLLPSLRPMYVHSNRCDWEALPEFRFTFAVVYSGVDLCF